MRRAFLILIALALGACAPASSDNSPAQTRPAATGEGSLPPAADGSNLDACRDGRCEVLVTAPAEFDVRGVETTVTVNGGRVTVRQADGEGSTSSITVSGTNNLSTVGTGTNMVAVRVKGVSGNNVVLDITPA